MKILYNICRFIAAIILLQTLYYKFGAHPDSVHIFEMMGVEPWGRYALGIAELLVAVGLFIPKLIKWSAAATVLMMLGAVVSHMFILGIEVNQDGGKLFFLALITLLSASYIWFFKIKYISA